MKAKPKDVNQCSKWKSSMLFKSDLEQKKLAIEMGPRPVTRSAMPRYKVYLSQNNPPYRNPN